jgi:hypothetical protein
MQKICARFDEKCLQGQRAIVTKERDPKIRELDGEVGLEAFFLLTRGG